MMKRTLTAAALAAVLAAPAFAQTPMSNANSSAKSSVTTNGQAGFVQQQNASDWRGSKLIGASVYGPDNASIGEISDVLIAGDGKIHAVVVGVGGFLGVGEKDVALPFNTLNITRKPDSSAIDKIKVSYSKDQLKNAPKFAFYEPSSTQTTTGAASGNNMSPAPKGGQAVTSTTHRPAPGLAAGRRFLCPACGGCRNCP